MSSLASVFNSSATIFTLDVYRPVCHPRASERQLLWVGRCSVVAMAALALLWLPVLPALGDQLFVIVQKPPAYLSPGILVCFVCGMFSRSANSAGALAALFVCTLLGMARLVMEVVEAVTDDSEERYSSDHRFGCCAGGGVMSPASSIGCVQSPTVFPFLLPRVPPTATWEDLFACTSCTLPPSTSPSAS